MNAHAHNPEVRLMKAKGTVAAARRDGDAAAIRDAYLRLSGLLVDLMRLGAAKHALRNATRIDADDGAITRRMRMRARIFIAEGKPDSALRLLRRVEQLTRARSKQRKA